MNKTIGYALLLLLALAAPFMVYPVFMMKLLCFILFACAFNLLLGYTGLLSFGHAAFLGGAGYITGWVMTSVIPDPVIGILAGTAFATLVGVIMGYVAIRRQGIYFAMITLALAQMFFFICLQAKFTGGEDGLQGVPRGMIAGILDLNNDFTMYYVVLAIVVAAYLLIYRTVHSPYGQILKAIKENEPRTISLGYDVDRFKLLCFTLSAALAGLAGATKTVVLGFATLTDVHWSMSGEVVLMTLVGGLGTVFGPMVGAAVIVTMQNYLAEMGAWVTVIQGAIFVAVVLAFRRGLVGEIANLLRVKL